MGLAFGVPLGFVFDVTMPIYDTNNKPHEAANALADILANCRPVFPVCCRHGPGFSGKTIDVRFSPKSQPEKVIGEAYDLSLGLLGGILFVGMTALSQVFNCRLISLKLMATGMMICLE